MLQDTIKAKAIKRIKNVIHIHGPEDYVPVIVLLGEIEAAVSATLTAVREGMPEEKVYDALKDDTFGQVDGFNTCRSEVLEMLDKL